VAKAIEEISGIQDKTNKTNGSVLNAVEKIPLMFQ
jgi:hypothetical protein